MSSEDELLAKLRLDEELALQRAARLVEFMRAVFENEAQLLRISDPEEVIMRGFHFRMTTPTLAIERPDDVEILQVPSGTSVTVISDPVPDSILVDVDWNGRRVMMFTRDLLERAERVPERAGAPGN
jgi:hypothetical protein